jgi:hypothetical protein
VNDEGELRERERTDHVAKVCRSSKTVGINSKGFSLSFELVADSIGAVHVLVKARGVKVHIGQSRKGAVQEKVFGFIRHFPTSLGDGVGPLCDPNIEVELKILKGRSFRIFSTNSDCGTAFVVLSLFTLGKGQDEMP